MGSSEKFCLKAVDDTLRGLQREDPSFLGKREPYTILFEANLGAWQVDRFKRSSEMTKTRKKGPKSGSHIETSQEEARTESSIMWAGIGLDSRLELSTKQFLSRVSAENKLRMSSS